MMSLFIEKLPMLSHRISHATHRKPIAPHRAPSRHIATHVNHVTPFNMHQCIPSSFYRSSNTSNERNSTINIFNTYMLSLFIENSHVL